MKRLKALWVLLPLIIVMGGLYPALNRHPVPIFVLKGANGAVEAFKISAPLNGQDAVVGTIPLTLDQKKEGGEILDQKDVRGLQALSKNFGSYPVVVGVPVTLEGWPGFLGGGVKGFFAEAMPGVFDNLQWTDRFYLALSVRQPPPAPFSPNEVALAAVAPAVSTPGSAPISISAPKPLATPGLVRVEILNGCGITNAADWVARRVKGPGVIITDTGNADNFHYATTLVRTCSGMPVALEEALERLGVEKDSVEEVPSLPPAVDAVVIVGKDYHKLRSRFRERNRH